MPRRNRPRHPNGITSDSGGRGVGAAFAWSRLEEGPDGDWMVRTVPAERATKLYRCPGCDHEIRLGVAHVVAWPTADHGSVADRRHWHTGCWKARDRRGPTRQWS